MNIMVIGGITSDKCDFECLKIKCIEIGRNLCFSGHNLIICSPFEDSADYWVFQGFTENNENSNVEIYYVNTTKVNSKIETLKSKNNVTTFPLSVKNNEKDYELTYSWLLCQLKALEKCDCLIAIGGRDSASANMLLKFAEWKRKIVLPFYGFGGAARYSFERLQYMLEDIFNERINELGSKEVNSSIVSEIGKFRRISKKRKIFVSYAQKRPYEADYIEILLRRRNVEFFRDENEFGAGENIMEEIKSNLYKSNTFIAVYCSEYACSPWCFYELELALDLKEKGLMDIWIIRVDDTRIISKRARDLNAYFVKNRKELEGKILELLLDKIKK